MKEKPAASGLNLPERPSRARNLYLDVMGAIKQSIFKRELSPGDVLPSETDLAARMGVSRPVIREAIRVLQTQGFLNVRRGNRGGTYVTDLERISLSDNLEDLILMGRVSVRNLIQARMLIEPEVCRLAAIQRNTDQCRRLENNVTAMLSTGEPAQKRALNLDFHRQLVTIAKNPIYTRTMGQIIDFLENFLRSLKPSHLYIHNDQDHLALSRAIADQQPETAADICKDHIGGMKKEMIRMETRWVQAMKDKRIS